MAIRVTVPSRYNAKLESLLPDVGNPNKADYYQTRTPMHYAAANGHLECLRMLLNAGGRCEIMDGDNKDCLDLATPAGRKILEKYRVRDLMFSDNDEKAAADENDEGISHDQSADNSAGQSSSRSSIDSASSDKNAVLGFVTMSVEYHSSKGTLKIRATQVTDILLPPPHTSMIHSIYIKSLLQPDKKADTKRKTEEVRVDGTEGHVHWKKQKHLSMQHVYTPMTFKFTRVLEYTGINSSVVKEKYLHIEVCITQRYSHRSFLVGMLNMPLKTAVKKIVRENVPLIPCMNYTIPANMRVYSALETQVTSNRNVFYSNPNVRGLIADSCDGDSEKAASNPDLQENRFLQSAISIDIPDDYSPIPKLDLGSLVLDESGYDSASSPPREYDSPDSHKVGQMSGNCRARANSASVADEERKSRSFFKFLKRRFSLKGKTASPPSLNTDVTSVEKSAAVWVDSGNNLPSQDHKETSERTAHKDECAAKHECLEADVGAEVPSWDYYDLPAEVPQAKVETPVVNKRASPVLLPMDTTLELRNPGTLLNTQESQTSENVQSKVSSYKKSQLPIPGKAVQYLVPSVIISNPEKNDKSDIANKPTAVTVEMKHLYSCKSEDTATGLSEVKVVRPKIFNTRSKIHVRKIPPIKDHMKLQNLREMNSRERMHVHATDTVTVTDESLPKDSNISKHRYTEDSAEVEGMDYGSKDVITVQASFEDNHGGTVAKPELRNAGFSSEPQTGHSKDNEVVRPKIRSANTRSETQVSRKPNQNKLFELLPDKADIPQARPRIKKLRRKKDIESQSQNSESVSNQTNSRDISQLQPSLIRNRKPDSPGKTNVDRSTKSSTIVDIDQLTFPSANSHVIELEDNISITELLDNSSLFKEPVSQSSMKGDVECGFHELPPERFSPTKNVLPMQVFVDESFVTSIDESVTNSKSFIPTTEL